MNTLHRLRSLRALQPAHALSFSALAASLLLAACGGGSGEAPPALAGGTADTAGPVITITDSVTATDATGDVTFTFAFNEDVGTSFTVDDVTVTGGTKGAFTRISGTRATLVVVPTPDATGTIALSIAAGRVSDALGNTNAVVNSQQAYNTVIPIVETRIVGFSEATAPVLAGFGGAEDATITADPTDASNRVARVVKSATAELWAGTTVSICPSAAIVRLPFTNTLTTVTARVWAPAAGIPVRMKVEDAADPAKSVETEALTTVAAGWQTLLFNFANPAAGTAALNLAHTYNKASLFFNFGRTGAAGGGGTFYFDDLAFRGSSFTVACPSAGGGGGATTTTISMDEGTPPALAGFGGAEDSTIVADPGNAANKVAKVVKSATAELWAGTTVSTLANQAIAPIGFSAGNTTITVRVWSPTAGTPVRLKVESATDPTKSVESEATTTVANGWQTLSFNFANQAAGTAALNLATTYDKASIFFNFGTTGAAAGGARTYYFENLTYPAAGSTGGGGGGTGGNNTFPAITFSAANTTYTLTGFGGAEDATLAVDPTGGTNMVARVVKSASAELWAGITVSTGANMSIARVPFTATARSMSMRVYVPAIGIPVRMKVEDASDPTKSVETEALSTAANTWHTLTFNFANQAAGTAAFNQATTYNKVSVFFNFGKTGAQGGAGTYFLDDINFVP